MPHRRTGGDLPDSHGPRPANPETYAKFVRFHREQEERVRKACKTFGDVMNAARVLPDCYVGVVHLLGRRRSHPAWKIATRRVEGRLGFDIDVGLCVSAIGTLHIDELPAGARDTWTNVSDTLDLYGLDYDSFIERLRKIASKKTTRQLKRL